MECKTVANRIFILEQQAGQLKPRRQTFLVQFIMKRYSESYLSCDSRSKERCGVDHTCSIGVRQSVAKPCAFAADPKQGKMRGVMPLKQMHTSQASLNMEGTEMRKKSGPRARELRHAQLAMGLASERAKEVCAVIVTKSEEQIAKKSMWLRVKPHM